MDKLYECIHAGVSEAIAGFTEAQMLELMGWNE